MIVEHLECQTKISGKPRMIQEYHAKGLNLCQNCDVKKKYQTQVDVIFGEGAYFIHECSGGNRGEMVIEHISCHTKRTCQPRVIEESRKTNLDICLDCRNQKSQSLENPKNKEKIEKYMIALENKENISEFKPLRIYNYVGITLQHSICGKIQNYTRRIKENKNSPIRCDYCHDTGYYYKQKLGTRFKLISEYKKREKKSGTGKQGKRQKVLLRHLENNCLHEFEINSDFNPEKITCPQCHLNSMKSDLQLELNLKFPKEFNVLSKYDNLHSVTTFSHNNDFCEGKPFETIANSLLRHGVCQSCLEKQNSYPYVSERVHELLGSSYTVIKDSFVSNSDFEIRHNETDCSHKVFKNTLRTLESGRGGCPVCGNVMSINERKLYDYFIQNNIPFEQEKTFPDFKYKDTGGSPRFDFYLVLNSQELLIEYDGEHHYRETKKWSTPLETVQQRDRIKTQYALDKQIPLLRISYLDKKNLIPILETFLNPYLTKKEPN